MLEGVINKSESEFKDVLNSTNIDYESLSKVGIITNTDDIDISIDFSVNDWLGASGAQGVYGIGTPTNYFYVAKWVSNNQVLVQVTSGATSYTRGFTITPLSLNNITVTGGQIFFNGIELGAGTGFNNKPVTIDKSIIRVGARAVDLTTTISGFVKGFSFDSETFKPSGNGLTYTGSNGTVVTRNTSTLDPINYYNLTAIQKV